MNIAICGSAHGTYDEDILRKAEEIGKELVNHAVTVVSGACLGYPHAAIVGAKKAGGKTKGVSPGKDEGEHTTVYRYPTDHFDDIEYTGLGAPGRNVPLVQNADAIIVIGGQSGSMIEFGIALQKGKAIGVLEGSGGITVLLPQIAEICSYTGKERIVFSENPRSLVSQLVGKFS